MRVLPMAGAAALGLLLLSACPKKAAPPPPPRPPSIQIPEGCAAPLAGTWTYADRPDWRYVAADDGGTLVLDVERAAATDGDGGTFAAYDGGIRPARDVVIALQRTPEGFVGAAQATVHTPARACAVAFPTRVVSCADGGLVLESSEALVVDEATCAVVRDAPPQIRTHTLVRVDAAAAPTSPADAG